MKYDKDLLYLAMDFLEENIESAGHEEEAVMFRYILTVIQTLIKE